MANRWRHCAHLTGPGIDPKTPRTDNKWLTTELTDWLIKNERDKNKLEANNPLLLELEEFRLAKEKGSNLG